MPRHRNIGPSAPWSEDEEIEYVDDGVLYTSTVDEAVEVLAENLESRVDLLRAEPTIEAITAEVQRQMATAAAQGDFGTVRELNDLLLGVYLAKENARRAV